MKKTSALFFFASLFFTLLFLNPIPAAAEEFADGIIVPEPPIMGPIPLSGALDIRYHRVNVTIDAQVAITHVDQVFHNPNDFTVEGTYIFPLPKGASVTNFTLWIDGQPVEGQVLSAEEARATYEEIVRKMIDPAILEYVGQGAVQASIFPIEPGQDRRIELEYAQAITAEGGLIRYQYPLNTEKFSRSPLEQVTISVDVSSESPIRAVYSPSHDVAISREGSHNVRVGYEDANVTPDTDFLLFYSIGDGEAMHLLSYRDPHDPADPDGFYMLMLAPRPETSSAPLPKDILIVLDKSGSMDGDKYMQAQDAVRFILENLNPEDGFNLVQFSTGVELFARELQPVSAAAEAIRWVQADRPLGSTDINRALLEAAALVKPDRPTYIIFLTDGLPTEGETDTQRILDNFAGSAPENVRLFAFGVGYDVDTFLLDLLSQNHHGTSSYVVPGERIDETISAFYQKISTPVLTDLELRIDGVTVFDDYPNPLPDLFAGSQIILVGRYLEGGSADITLSGTIDGRTQTFEFPEQHFASGLERSKETPAMQTIPRLWATRKIGFLLNEIRLRGPNQETIDQVVRLSIRYGIVTPYTSYLVTEAMALGDAAIDDLAQQEFEQQMEAPAEASGETAVNRAADQGAMEEADTVSAPPREAADMVRVVGSRTFIRIDGIWVDTAFDPDTMTTTKVPFLSEDYFALTAAQPDLGAAFALGKRVIAFSEGIAYEVVDSEEGGDPVQIPPADPQAQATEAPADPPNVDEPPAADPGAQAFPCLGGLLPLAFLPLLAVFRRKKVI